MSLRVEFDDAGQCRVLNHDGNLLSTLQTVYEPVFNRQYPPPLSPDGRVLYVGTWERGLFCYDVQSAKLKWRKGPGRVRHIFPFNGGVLTEMFGRGLFRRCQETGEQTGTVKMSGIENAFRLEGDRVFAGPLRKHHYIYALKGLQVLASVHERELNPEGCLSFAIRDVFELQGELVIRGFEDYPGGDYNRHEQTNFERRVRPAQPDGAANASQPVRSGTNPASGAGGFRR